MRPTCSIWVAVALALTGGCSLLVQEAPVLGRVDNGTYHHRSGLFSCPVPDATYGFRGEVVIEDASRKPIYRENIRFEKEYIGAETIPRAGVKFIDSTDKNTEIEIRPVPPAVVRNYVTDHGGLDESVLRDRFVGGFAALIHEERVNDGRHNFAYAVMQVPYYRGDLEYMGSNLRQTHLHSQAPPAQVLLIANIIVGKVVYQVSLQTSSLPFLPNGTDWRDLQAVRDALEANPAFLPLMRKRIFTLLERCEFGAVMSGGYNPGAQ